MITVNAMGDACPIPVVKTKNAIASLKGADVVETLVDNEIAVENLKKERKLKNFIKKSPDFRAIRAEIVERFCFSNANSEAIMCLQHSSGECDCCRFLFFP